MKKVIVVRHEEHVMNLLTPEARLRAEATGKALKEMGIKIDRVVTSPQWRCVETAREMLVGYGEMIPLTGTSPLLGDLALDGQIPKEMKDGLKKEVTSKYGEFNDANIARLMYEDPKYHADMIRRAYEGAEFIKNLLLVSPDDVDETTLVVSHGVGRIEPAINVLLGRKDEEILNIIDDLFQPGEMRILHFEDNELASIEKL